MKILILTTSIIGLFCLLASAEPWIANRFAKNCAACHAPGRVNVKPAKRRCTLSCQGCHVNPNGGGIRNSYGVWNQKMWLRSANSELWKQNSKLPKAYKDQPYNHKKVAKRLSKLSKRKRRYFIAKKADEGLKAEYTAKNLDESNFTRHNAADEHNIEKNWDKVKLRIPQDDPYRQRRTNIVTAGGDFRYFVYSGKKKVTPANSPSSSDKSYWTIPMAFDLGARIMPIDKISFVTEARFQNAPTKAASVLDRQFQTSMVRSAYFLIDDLWYNTFVMKGLYRPMFGYYNIDHNSLSTKITGLNYSYIANATSIGTNPNVPFFQVHLIEPTSRIINSTRSKDEGVVLNAGARFITLGASIVLSSWSTTNKYDPRNAKRVMNSLNLGFSEWDLTTNVDLVQYEVTSTSSKDKGFYWLLDMKYRLWKEIYATMTKAVANTARNLSEGKSDDISIGLKGFILNGIELELLLITRNDAPKNKTAEQVNAFQGQLHWFF